MVLCSAGEHIQGLWRSNGSLRGELSGPCLGPLQLGEASFLSPEGSGLHQVSGHSSLHLALFLPPHSPHLTLFPLWHSHHKHARFLSFLIPPSSTPCHLTHTHKTLSQHPMALLQKLDVAMVGAGPAGLLMARAVTRALPAGTTVKVRPGTPIQGLFVWLFLQLLYCHIERDDQSPWIVPDLTQFCWSIVRRSLTHPQPTYN
jgi:hypothetical protein